MSRLGKALDLDPMSPQTLKRSDAQTFSRLNAETPRISSVPAAGRSNAQTPGRLGVPLSQQPGVAKKTLYLSEDTMDEAFRKFKADVGPRPAGKKATESEMVQMLLDRYVGGRHG